MAEEVRDDRARHRFELEIGGETAFAAYRLEGPNIVFTHTIVPPALEGRGIGSRLVRDALEKVRAEGLKVVPLCPFVEAYIGKHPETRDLLA
jgi:predicted GNAT family acetyltransferase